MPSALYWPGAVGMFLDSGTPYYVAPTYRDLKRVGQWQGFAPCAGDALDQAIRVSDRVFRKYGVRVTVGQPRELTRGETAAIITGAPITPTED